MGAFIFRGVQAGRVTPVRAVVVNQSAWVGNRGGQRTARPATTKCAKATVICHSHRFDEMGVHKTSRTGSIVTTAQNFIDSTKC